MYAVRRTGTQNSKSARGRPTVTFRVEFHRADRNNPRVAFGGERLQINHDVSHLLFLTNNYFVYAVQSIDG